MALYGVAPLEVFPDNSPKYSNEFLSIGVGARALGMGNAFVSLAGDATSGYWNPAGLNRLQPNLQVALMHTEYFAGIASYDFGAIAFDLGPRNGLAFSFIRFGVDDIPDTSELIDSDGNINYDRVRSFSASDNAFMLSYAHLLNPNLSIGINTKIIRRTAGNFASAWGFGLDAGLQYSLERWQFAIVGRDITSTFNAWTFNLDDRMREVFTITGNEIPENSIELTMPRIVLGASRSFPFNDKFGMLASADLNITTDGKRNTLIKGDPFSIDPSMGLEFDYNQVVFLRAGAGNFQRYYTSEEDYSASVRFSMGMGVVIRDFLVLDYALTDVGNTSIAEYSNVFSIKLNINRRETTHGN